MPLHVTHPPGHTLEELQWPAEPLRTTLLRGLSKLGLARYAQKYEAVQVRGVGGCESVRRSRSRRGCACEVC
jgi:hypothetical protein